MAGLEIKGLQAFIKKSEMERLRAKAKITEGVRRVVAGVFRDVVMTTPQYSGNLASNWYIVYGSWGSPYHELSTHGVRTKQPYERGDDPAVSETLDRELWKLDNIRWNSKVTIRNSTPYATEVEAGIGPNNLEIRPENKIGGEVVMAELTAMKYQFDRSAVTKLLRGIR